MRAISAPAVDEGDASVGAATVHWRRAGTGPAIVFLRGFPLAGTTWQPVVERLVQRSTGVMPDMIGLGGSSGTDDQDYASPGQARAIRGALDFYLKQPQALADELSGLIDR